MIEQLSWNDESKEALPIRGPIELEKGFVQASFPDFERRRPE
jgi:hypothetical protein